MTQREKDLFYEVLELLRKEVRTSSDFRNRDWKDADDYIFSALHLTQVQWYEVKWVRKKKIKRNRVKSTV